MDRLKEENRGHLTSLTHSTPDPQSGACSGLTVSDSQTVNIAAKVRDQVERKKFQQDPVSILVSGGQQAHTATECYPY